MTEMTCRDLQPHLPSVSVACCWSARPGGQAPRPKSRLKAWKRLGKGLKKAGCQAEVPSFSPSAHLEDHLSCLCLLRILKVNWPLMRKRMNSSLGGCLNLLKAFWRISAMVAMRMPSRGWPSKALVAICASCTSWKTQRHSEAERWSLGHRRTRCGGGAKVRGKGRFFDLKT